MRRQAIQTEHRTDEDGQPAGGTTRGVGIDIEWHRGAMLEGQDLNGACVEGVLDAARSRLRYTTSPFGCADHKAALACLDQALACLDRTTAKKRQGARAV